VTYEMLVSYWPHQKNDDMGPALIDEYRFLVHPIIMGSGKRFFKDWMDEAEARQDANTQLGGRATLLPAGNKLTL